LKNSGRRVSATIAGEGSFEPQLKLQAKRLQVGDRIRFVGHRPAREAFALGRMLIVTSRFESLPYVVLEAAAAGMPMIATRVGGIPEIFGPEAAHLIAPGDAAALAAAIGAALDAPAQLRGVAQAVKTRVRRDFSVAAMVDGGLAAYREAIAMRKLAQFA
jgi:glycosyltransferase involved in cell wall biosynthesis